MPRFRRSVVSFPALALALAACHDLNAPGPLQVTVAARPDAITPGDTTAIVVTVRNVSSGPVTFMSMCNVGFELEASDGATPVTLPSGICLAIYGPVTLQAFESLERAFQWDGFRHVCTGSPCVRAPVAAGFYRLRGGLHYEDAAIRSAPVPFTIE